MQWKDNNHNNSNNDHNVDPKQLRRRHVEYSRIKRVYDDPYRSQHWCMRPLTYERLRMAVSDIEFYFVIAEIQKRVVVAKRINQTHATQRSNTESLRLGMMAGVESDVELVYRNYRRFVGPDHRQLRNLMTNTRTHVVEMNDPVDKTQTKFAIWYKNAAGLADVKVNMGHNIQPKLGIAYKSLRVEDDHIYYEKKRMNRHGNWKPWIPYSKPSFMLVGTKPKHMKLRKMVITKEDQMRDPGNKN
jgi:hypothetical protein